MLPPVEISLVDLKDLAKKVEKIPMTDRYRVFQIPKPKKPGQYRTIEAPCDELKEFQRLLLPYLYRVLRSSPFSHGFMPKDSRYVEGPRNLVTMAAQHAGRDWVACFDFEDFFPSVNLNDVCHHIRLETMTLRDGKGHPVEHGSTIWGMAKKLCFHDFGCQDTYPDGKYKRARLPQGAPTSPWIANAALRKFDEIVAKIASDNDIRYGRYADDMAFSGMNDGARPELAKWILTKVIDSCGWTGKIRLKDSKTRVLRKHHKQLVCGLVVNGEPDITKPRLPRRWRRNLRAALFQGDTSSHTAGRVALLSMVNKTNEEFGQMQLSDNLVKTRAMRSL